MVVKGVYVLRRLKYCLSLNYLKTVFHALIQAHLRYGILFWGSAHRARELFIWQKKALTIILGLLNRQSCRGNFRKLEILTVPCLYAYTAITFIEIEVYLSIYC